MNQAVVCSQCLIWCDRSLGPALHRLGAPQQRYWLRTTAWFVLVQQPVPAWQETAALPLAQYLCLAAQPAICITAVSVSGCVFLFCFRYSSVQDYCISMGDKQGGCCAPLSHGQSHSRARHLFPAGSLTTAQKLTVLLLQTVDLQHWCCQCFGNRSTPCTQNIVSIGTGTHMQLYT